MTACKRCGSTDVAWYQTKAGKFYLIRKGGGPRDFHSKVCDLPLNHDGAPTSTRPDKCCQRCVTDLHDRMDRGAASAARAVAGHVVLNSRR